MGIFCAVLGSPIAHSLSPLLHTSAAAALHVDLDYGRYEVRAPELRGFLKEHPHLMGLSLTMPLKQEVLAIALESGWQVDPHAALSGAANTLIRGSRPGAWNTDIEGIKAALAGEHPQGSPLSARLGETPVALLGGGATAVSALIALCELGVKNMTAYARVPAKLHEVQTMARELQVNVRVDSLAAWSPANYALSVSTLPAGAVQTYLRELPGPVDPATTFFDVAYGPAAVPAHAILQSAGIHVITGTRMLMEQAVAQFVLFCAAAGLTVADRERVRAAMAAALPG